MSNGIINWFRFASPQTFYPLAGKLIPWFWALTAVFGVMMIFLPWAGLLALGWLVGASSLCFGLLLVVVVLYGRGGLLGALDGLRRGVGARAP